jgi:hypothetical protein
MHRQCYHGYWMDVQLYVVCLVALRRKGWYDYVRRVGLLVDRGRIDNMVGFPFWVYACITEVRVMRSTAGGLRADSLRGHRRHIRPFFFPSRCSILLTLDFERRHTFEDGQDWASVLVHSLGCR